MDLVADDRAEERRPAADQAGEPEPAPRRAHAAERADDAEPLGRVVQAEADDQDGREADRAGLGRDADREALGEVVQPDRDGDRHARSAARAGGASAAALRTRELAPRRARLGGVPPAIGAAARAHASAACRSSAGDAGGAGGEADREQREQPEHVAEAAGVPALKLRQRRWR